MKFENLQDRADRGGYYNRKTKTNRIIFSNTP